MRKYSKERNEKISLSKTKSFDDFLNKFYSELARKIPRL